jgi:cadmium resistance protein CadD (predicted permease)
VNELLSVIGLAVATFVATSFDNFTLLLGFYADDEYPRRQVAAGYLGSALLVVLAAWTASAAAELAPASFLGLLGLIPLSLGVVGLYRLIREAGSETVSTRSSPSKGFLPVLLVMLANSGDSLSVLVSVFADTAESLEIPVVLTVAACALVYSALARWLVTRSGIGLRIQRVAPVVLPFLLIAIGIYILLDTGTDVAL